MDREQLREAQLCQLEIAKEIKRICEKHNIQYFIAYGSMLGAIRHQGFIPWDDDLDIALLRPEYDRLINICKYELDDAFFLQNYDNDRYYTWPYSKLQKKGTIYKEAGVDERTASGVFIDIFPIESVPRWPKLNRFRYKYYLRILQTKLNYTLSLTANNRILKKILSIISGVYDIQFLKNKIKKISTRNLDNQSKYVYNIHSPYSLDKEIMPREWFEDTISLDFEGVKFPVLKKYDMYLRHLYGEYMVLPPESERENRHQIIDFSCK